MLYRIKVIGHEIAPTIDRPISSQTEPIDAFTLVIFTENIPTVVPTVVPTLTSTVPTVVPTVVPTLTSTVPTLTSAKIKKTKSILYDNEIRSKRRVKLRGLCEYLHEKLQHCKTNETYHHTSDCSTYRARIRCNYEWLISVLETEIDYHLGKRRCTKKYNDKYMREYTATQLSGFGEKFYHCDNNISRSRIAQMYKMNIKSKNVK